MRRHAGAHRGSRHRAGRPGDDCGASGTTGMPRLEAVPLVRHAVLQAPRATSPYLHTLVAAPTALAFRTNALEHVVGCSPLHPAAPGALVGVARHHAH